MLQAEFAPESPDLGILAQTAVRLIFKYSSRDPQIFRLMCSNKAPGPWRSALRAVRRLKTTTPNDGQT